MNGLAYRLVGALAAACGLCVLFAFLNRWLWFGMTAWGVLALALALGIGRGSRARRVAGLPLAIFLAYCSFLGAMAWTYDPAGEPRLLLGLPISTAFLVYGIVPLGVVPGIFYALLFDRWILPADRLERFRREHGQGEASD